MMTLMMPLVGSRLRPFTTAAVAGRQQQLQWTGLQWVAAVGWLGRVAVMGQGGAVAVCCVGLS